MRGRQVERENNWPLNAPAGESRCGQCNGQRSEVGQQASGCEGAGCDVRVREGTDEGGAGYAIIFAATTGVRVSGQCDC